MVEPMTPEAFDDIASKLERIYDDISPNPVFYSRLEASLVAHRETQPTGFAFLLHGLRRRPLLAVGLSLILFLAILISAFGPQRVLAEVGRLFGYLPGTGFVPIGETRILAAPVEARQGNVVVRVEKVVADADHTRVDFTVIGRPCPACNHSYSYVGYEPYLLLPDGRRITPSNSAVQFAFELGDMQATLYFPGLEKDITQIQLVLPRLPEYPAGAAPENWSLPISLVPATPIVQPYVPACAQARKQGVTVTILQVAQYKVETGIQMEIKWQNPAWKRIENAVITLADENGHEYQPGRLDFGEIEQPETQETNTRQLTRTMRFDPFLPGANRANMTVSDLVFEITSDTSFTFDPGSNPQPGKIWDLSATRGMNLNIAGVPVHVMSVWLDTISAQPPPDLQENEVWAEANDHYRLTFQVQTQPTRESSLQCITLKLEGDQANSSGCQGSDDGRMSLYLNLPSLPSRPLVVSVSEASLNVHGPWVISWDLPPTQ
jgi:hypothetical protein